MSMSSMGEHVTTDWWGAGRAVPIVHALDALLDHMEGRLDEYGSGQPASHRDLLPLSTGILPLDRVLGGGVRRGCVTTVEADVAAQANALLCTVARRIPYPCLLDSGRLLSTVAWLLAGSAGVPEVGITAADLSEQEWKRLALGVEQLGDRQLCISSVGSLRALAAVAQRSAVDVLLVHEADRLAAPIELVKELTKLAELTGLAIIATTGSFGELPEWVPEGVVRVPMASFNLGGKATLLRVDDEEMLATVQVEVDCLSGDVR